MMLGRLFDVFVPFGEMAEDTLGFPPILVVAALLILAAVLVVIVLKVKHTQKAHLSEEANPSREDEDL